MFFLVLIPVCSQAASKPSKTNAKETKSETKTKAKAKGKKVKKTVGKASFKRTGKRVVKPACPNSAKSAPLKYGDYDLSALPHGARPDMGKTNLGKHSYTLSFDGTIEVLLNKEAYYVKKIGSNGVGPTGQISWSKNGGPLASFKIAVERAGFDRPNGA